VPQTQLDAGVRDVYVLSDWRDSADTIIDQIKLIKVCAPPPQKKCGRPRTAAVTHVPARTQGAGYSIKPAFKNARSLTTKASGMHGLVGTGSKVLGATRDGRYPSNIINEMH
jgi:hypothetical protein